MKKEDLSLEDEKVQEDKLNPSSLLYTNRKSRKDYRSRIPNPTRPDPETPMIDSSDIRMKNINKEEEKFFPNESKDYMDNKFTVNPRTGTLRDQVILGIDVGSFTADEDNNLSQAASLKGKQRYTTVSNNSKLLNYEAKDKLKDRQRSLDEYKNSPEHDYHIYPECWCENCELGFDPKDVNANLRTFLEREKVC